MFKLWPLVSPYRKSLAAILVLMLAQTLATLYLPTLMADIVNVGVVGKNSAFILQTGGFMLLVAALTALTAVAGSWLSAKLSAFFCRDLRHAIFVKAQSFSLNDFSKIGTASMITRSTSDVNLLGQSLTMFLQMLLPAPIMAMAGLLLAYRKDPAMAGIIVLIMGAFMLVAIFFGKQVISLFKMLQIKMDQINRVLREIITGVRVIRAFDRCDFEKNRLNATAQDYANTSIKINKLFALMLPLIMTIMNLGIVAILWFGSIKVSHGQLQIGDIMALIEYCTLILFYLIMGIMVFMYIPRAAACADRLNAVLAVTPEITDPVPSLDTVPKISNFLTFEHVTFRYPQAEEAVLSDLNFTIKAGEVAAIIGGTGSGKSTIAGLIPRFFEIAAGTISLGGQDIRHLSQSALRAAIGYVPQKAFLFSGTIAENIAYGLPDATPEQIRHAAEIAQAHDFIMTLPGGYDAPVAQGGANLSGGQKQRLAIARALVKQPSLYLFDDSFSALDFKTDARLRAALKAETHGATVLMIAQRITTIMDADRIIVLDDGKIADIGTHQTLLQTSEVYRQIAASQLSPAELATAYTGGSHE